MKNFEIDLYSYFKIEKPSGAKGCLTCLLPSNSQEISLSRKRPSILILAGGGYSFVSFREQESVALKFLSNGFNAFILNYSCYPNAYPNAFNESAMAMAYIRKNCGELNAIEDKVASIGFSAGGHLLGCLSTAYNTDKTDFLGKDKRQVRPDASLYIYPVVTCGEKGHKGSFENLLGDSLNELKKYFSIENNVHKDCPPAFILSTFNDNSVPVLNSLLLANAYEKNGVPFELHVFEKGLHGASTGEIQSSKAKSLDYYDLSSYYKKWTDMAISWLKDRNFMPVD